MAHCFAEGPTLSCPECGQAFSADIWVDRAAAITDRLVEDVLLNNGCRIQVDRKGLVFYMFPSKKLLLLLGAALVSAEKVFRVIQIILS